MSADERADAILAGYPQTTLGWLGGPDDNPNHVRGVTAGRLRVQIAAAIRAAVAAEREACARAAEDAIANGVVVLSAGEVANFIRSRP